ncbi:MAG: response regulator [Candidatus Doudnabacteria bacterium]|nr:response regulator [Candidatus Doudnabacteria bacterium]
MSTEKMKILIVDDDTFLLNMYAMKFTKADLEVKTATSGEQALEILRDGFQPQIMMLDIIMPTIDGLELLEQAKKDHLVDGAVYVMLSNQGDAKDIDRAKKLGVHGYIVKATTIPSEVVTEVMNIYNNNKKT